MRKIRMVIISALLLISLSISVILQANAVSIYTDGAYTYADIDQDNVALYGYDNSDPVLTVPEYYYGRRVSSVYDYAFQNNEYLTQLDFSENSRFITSIGTVVNQNAGIRCFSGLYGLDFCNGKHRCKNNSCSVL